MTQQSQRKESAFEAGRKASAENKPKSSNPYGKGLGLIWLAGYAIGRTKLYKTFDTIKTKLKLRTKTEKNQQKRLRKRLRSAY